MKTLAVTISLLMLLAFAVAMQATVAERQQPRADDAQDAGGGTRFTTIEVHIDPAGEPLGAYQFVFDAGPGGASGATGARIVGLEGGGHPAFDEPPYYDRQAIQKQTDRIIVAAFNTSAPRQLPSEKNHIATLHLAMPGDAETDFNVKLQTAANHKGESIEATLTTQPKGQSNE